jgi:hypothetical protein
MEKRKFAYREYRVNYRAYGNRAESQSRFAGKRSLSLSLGISIYIVKHELNAKRTQINDDCDNAAIAGTYDLVQFLIG